MRRRRLTISSRRAGAAPCSSSFSACSPPGHALTRSQPGVVDRADHARVAVVVDALRRRAARGRAGSRASPRSRTAAGSPGAASAPRRQVARVGRLRRSRGAIRYASRNVALKRRRLPKPAASATSVIGSVGLGQQLLGEQQPARAVHADRRRAEALDEQAPQLAFAEADAFGQRRQRLLGQRAFVDQLQRARDRRIAAPPARRRRATAPGRQRRQGRKPAASAAAALR